MYKGLTKVLDLKMKNTNGGDHTDLRFLSLSIHKNNTYRTLSGEDDVSLARHVSLVQLIAHDHKLVSLQLFEAFTHNLRLGMIEAPFYKEIYRRQCIKNPKKMDDRNDARRRK